ncbi:MAG: DUF721 domain-containing protein [Synergistaceae bacterium]|nr:DUF721 domain-containing protein [Synergistaceae bacterium]
MKKIDGARAAGDIVRAGIGNHAKSMADAERWAQLTLSVKLAELEERWEEIAGSPLAQKSQPAQCEYSEEIMTLTVNVSEQSILSAVRFRRAQIEKRVAAFFGCKKIKVDFRVGPIVRRSQAQEQLPSYKRRAPLVLSDEDVEAERRDFEESGISEELALRMARVKLSLEKLAKRASN